MDKKLSLKQEAAPHVMTIAGSDSGGGAGIQADLKTIEAFKCFGSSVLTAVTAQNTQGVQGVHNIPTDFVMKQLEAVWRDERPKAVKLGMLTSSATVIALSNFFAKNTNSVSYPVIVLDPVMVATSGHTLVDADTMEAISTILFDHVDWITPNIPEAEVIAGRDTPLDARSGILDLIDLLHEVSEVADVPYVLLKGGHLPLKLEEVRDIRSAARKSNIEMIWLDEGLEGECIDVLEGYRSLLDGGKNELPPRAMVDLLHEKEEDRWTMFVSRMVDTESTHGTGCTLSSAIACSAALAGSAGNRISGRETCKRAIQYVKSAIASAYPIGEGHGPLNHAHLSFTRALPPPTQSNPHPFVSHLILSDLPLWKSYVRHPFVVQLGNGTLPRKSFEHYIKQDYLYLRHYARAHALGAYKSSTFESISAFTEITAHIARESAMHVQYCESFGISLADLLSTPEAAPCAAYARYILDIGAQGDILDLYVAVASCLIGYGEVGLWLQKEVKEGRAKMDGNIYSKWMADYCGEDFIGAVNRGIENLERLVATDPPTPARLARLTKIWTDCVRLERDFWEMGLKLI